jgi:hypothetical protein
MKPIIIPINNYHGLKLKQRLEIYVDDEKYKELDELSQTDKDKYVECIGQIAYNHVKKYGYTNGNCSFHKKDVSYDQCLSCGIDKSMSMKDWNQCRNKHISYPYATTKAPKTIKDEKIRKKLELTPEEVEQAKKLYIIDK